MLSGFAPDGWLPDGDIAPEDIGATGVAALYLSTNGYVTGSGDDPASTYWHARLLQPLLYERGLDGQDGFVGVARASGEIDVADADRNFRTLVEGFAIDGRQVAVERLRRGQTYAERTTAFDGTAAGWSRPDMLLRVRLRDTLWRLAYPILRGRYGGTGGADGTENLLGVPIPLTFGNCRNVRGLLVDPATGLYQFHDGPIQAFVAVYDGADQLSDGVHYNADIATGCIAMLQDVVFEITADILGSKTGGNYVDSTAFIAHRIITEHSELGAQLLELQTVDRLEGANSAEVGIHVPPTEMLALDVLAELMAGVGGFVDVAAGGRLELGVFGGDWLGDTFTIDERHILDIEPVSLPGRIDPPWAGVRVGYARAWHVMTAGVAEGADADDKQFVAQEYRFAEAIGDESGAHQLAFTPNLAGLFADEADAQAEAVRRLALYGVGRGLYRVALPLTHGFRIGMQGRLRWRNYNLQDGRDCWVTRIRFDGGAGVVTVDLLA